MFNLLRKNDGMKNREEIGPLSSGLVSKSRTVAVTMRLRRN